MLILALGWVNFKRESTLISCEPSHRVINWRMKCRMEEG